MKKSIFCDMLLNIVASMIPIAVLQLWILPSLGKAIPEEEYGLAITIVAFFSVLPGASGNVLNNVRLIHAKEGERSNQTDFNVVLACLCCLNLLGVIGFSALYDKEITLIGIALNIIASLLLLLHEYYIVAFRININYIYVVVSNVFLTFGYGLGYGLFKVCGYWQFIYIVGYLVSDIYIMSKCDLWKEPLKISTKFKRISSDTGFLMTSGILGGAVTYADKLLIFPLLGGGTVAVYHAATVFSKVISMAVSPISSVMLTYLSKIRKKENNVFLITLLTGTVVCIFGYALCIFLSKPVIGVLYPQYVEEAIKYIYITTGVAVLQALYSLISPFVLRFFDSMWQLWFSGGTVVLYVVLCVSMLYKWGLRGLCIGVLLANAFKVAFLIIIYAKCKTRREISDNG